TLYYPVDNSSRFLRQLHRKRPVLFRLLEHTIERNDKGPSEMPVSLVRNGRHLVKVGHERWHHVGKERLTERKTRHSRLTRNEFLVLTPTHILTAHLRSVVEQLPVYHRYIVLACGLVT